VSDELGGKLVRDRIPEIIRAGGRTPNVDRLAEGQRVTALIAKVHEEADELAAATGPEVIGELADLFEVLRALVAECGQSWDSVEAAAAIKCAERGAFAEGWILRG
jgi:predicted house-cleaning noncanonical NTP pyrophosphatase (MazG superfamily)